jgi:hypothetical protein
MHTYRFSYVTNMPKKKSLLGPRIDQTLGSALQCTSIRSGPRINQVTVPMLLLCMEIKIQTLVDIDQGISYSHKQRQGFSSLD